VNSLASSIDSGSFRDREGRVYRCGERILRGLSERSLGYFHDLGETRFFRAALSAGRVVGTRQVELDQVPLPAEARGQWAGFLEHDRVPVISYPYEWSFSMLKAAALLQLDLLAAALEEDWTLKDSTPYNVQFVDGRPVFIDIPSFEPLAPGEPWVGRRQFCELYLFPLMLQAYKDIPFQPFLRSSIDGVSLHTANGIFGLRDRLRPGVLGNVWLQAKLDRRLGSTRADVRSDLKAAGFNKELIRANVRKLHKLVSRLQWRQGQSEWGDYRHFHNYSESDHAAKEDFIRQAVQTSQVSTVWDIGCNTGQFSKVAAAHCDRVVATDIDHLAIERLFLDPERPDNVLPLLQNVADPSPDWGWRNRERLALDSRSRPDLVLCLALIHHVVITANVPLAEFIEWLAGLAPRLVIEYVSREDDKVQTLLRNKEDRYWDYHRDYLEEQLGKYFTIEQHASLREGARTLYSCRRLT
jgi:SAM-dependent methyltransferase